MPINDKEWWKRLGGKFDPKAFDINRVNLALQRVG